MPYAPSNLQDEEKKKDEQGGTNVSGSSTSFSTNVPGQDAATATKDKTSSGQYANIQSYLDANKDQADQMGSNISQNIENKGAEAQTAVTDYGSKAPKVAAYDPNAALGKVTTLSDQEKQDYKAQRATGGYTGPDTFDAMEGYKDAAEKSAKASVLAKNAATEVGQQQLLKDTYARPSYTAGQNKLDQVLLQGSEGSKQALQGVSQKYSDLDKLFSDAQNKVGGAINESKAQALANKQNISAAEKAAREGLINPIQQRAAEQNAANQALISRVTGDVSDDVLGQDVLSQLGLNEGQNLYDLNLSNYLNTDATQVGLNQAANADERAKYAALAGLFDDASMNQIDANGKPINAVSFDNSRFTSDLGKKQAEYENSYNNERVFPFAFSQNGPSMSTAKEVETGIENYKNLINTDPNNAGRYQSFINTGQKQLDDYKNKFAVNRKISKG